MAFANGHFDLLHVGHLRYLRAARAEADALVVAINDDDFGRAASRGPGRPLVPAAERAELLAALEPVDFVVVFSGDSPAPLLAELRPDVHCKGPDYRTPEQVPEYATVREYGGRTALVGDPKDHATSDLVARIRKIEDALRLSGAVAAMPTRRSPPHRSRSGSRARPNGMLLVRTSALGDVVHSLPALIALHRALPERAHRLGRRRGLRAAARRASGARRGDPGRAAALAALTRSGEHPARARRGGPAAARLPRRRRRGSDGQPQRGRLLARLSGAPIRLGARRPSGASPRALSGSTDRVPLRGATPPSVPARSWRRSPPATRSTSAAPRWRLTSHRRRAPSAPSIRAVTYCCSRQPAGATRSCRRSAGRRWRRGWPAPPRCRSSSSPARARRSAPHASRRRAPAPPGRCRHPAWASSPPCCAAHAGRRRRHRTPASRPCARHTSARGPRPHRPGTPRALGCAGARRRPPSALQLLL